MNYYSRLHTWLNYRLNSKSKFKIHSPFVYDLIVNVFEDHTVYPEYLKIEGRKKRLRKDRRKISRKDLGTGQSQPEIPEKISTIVKEQSVAYKYGRLLFRMVRKFKPVNILELGTSLGISTSYLSAANPESKIITVEGCPLTASIAKETFDILNFRNVEVVTGNFDMVLPEILKEIPSPDLVFIDGNHRKEKVLDYFSRLVPVTSNDTLLIFDDIHWSREMEEAWEQICMHEKIKISIDLFQFGLVFFKKELSKERFIIRYS
jgi:predicted O-methyltransferase YrrM